MQAGSIARYSRRVPDSALPRFVTGTRTSAERLERAHDTCTGASKPEHQPLVGVDQLVGDGGDLGGVAEQPGDELPGDRRQAVLAVGIAEGVVLARHSERWVCMPEPCTPGHRLGHERRVHAVAVGDLTHDHAQRHHVVGHGQAVGVAEVDLVLGRRVLVERVLDGDAGGLEATDGGAADVARRVEGREVEVAGVVERLTDRAEASSEPR